MLMVEVVVHGHGVDGVGYVGGRVGGGCGHP